MQSNTQAGLKRLLHFAAVWDRIHKTKLVEAIGKSESLLNSLQKVGIAGGAAVQYKANAFVHKIPFLDLLQVNIDHARLTKLCDPTKIPHANYAAVTTFGSIIWVATDKPAAPIFRQKITELVAPLTPVIVTSDQDVVISVAEQARAALTMFKGSSFTSPEPKAFPSTPRKDHEVQPIKPFIAKDVDAEVDDSQVQPSTDARTQTPSSSPELGRRFAPTPVAKKPETAKFDDGSPQEQDEIIEVVEQVSRHSVERDQVASEASFEDRLVKRVHAKPVLPDDVLKKFTDCLKKLDRECATAGKTIIQTLTTLAFGVGADRVYFTPSEGHNSSADISIRLHGRVMGVGSVRMNTFPAVCAVLRDIHSMGKDNFSAPYSGEMVVRFHAEGQKHEYISRCSAVGYGTGSLFETYTISIVTENVTPLRELLPDYSNTFKLNRGFTLVGSASFDIRRGFLEALALEHTAISERQGLVGLTGHGVRLAPNSKTENIAQFFELVTGMGLDSLFVGEIDVSGIKQLSTLAGTTPVVLGCNAPSFELLFDRVIDSFGPSGIIAEIEQIVYITDVPLLCSCARNSEPEGCELCNGTGYNELVTLVDSMQINKGVMENLLKKTHPKLKDLHTPNMLPKIKELFIKDRITKAQAVRLLCGNLDLASGDWIA